MAGFLGPNVLSSVVSDRSLRRATLPSRSKGLRSFARWGGAFATMSASGIRDEPWIGCSSVFAVGKVLEYLGVNGLSINAASFLAGHWHVLKCSLDPIGPKPGPSPSRCRSLSRARVP